MNFTLPTTIAKAFRNVLLLAITCTVFACQETVETDDTPQTETETPVSEEESTETRPAPTFFIVPPDLADKRVWICENTSSDIFHVQHDCPLLVQCKGNYRNVTIPRAIETYGRYNCQVCSKDLDHIFDEDMVR
ncbi:hypothetical protein DXT99_06435 [Pontibacter diazotrophicus]|uniref:Rieske domain-containing protein n=1 Tax=Pontibacter diazotrophicus TaxID=1400979 RepID=A0A3D8LF35_9BACT|nr:hypothetical protein [Pontibacter diazotrophicus]RDV16007.1 hypothetical protein DXT99_06435 [Pontibacter diazotrophicus]